MAVSPLSVSPLSVPQLADVDMRTSSKRGILDVESELVWMPVFLERMDTKFGRFERKVDQVLGLHQTRLDKHVTELASQRQLLEDLLTEVSLLRESGTGLGRMDSDPPSDTPSPVGSSSVSLYERYPQIVQVRGWAPFGSRPAAKIDRIEFEKLTEDLLSMLPTCLQNQVVVRAPFAAFFQLVLGIKGDALSAGIEHRGLMVKGQLLRVSVELSPRKKSTLSNIFRAESLKKKGVSAEKYTLCPRSCKILDKSTNEDFGETPKGSKCLEPGIMKSARMVA